jgi:Icc-related predicted phosphoesterase
LEKSIFTLVVSFCCHNDSTTNIIPKIMKIWCISDTHGKHDQLIVPDRIDMIIHAGDISNPRQLAPSIIECTDFLEWYKHLKPELKILIPGNHDTALERRAVNPKDYGIICLNHERDVVGKMGKPIQIFGSPYTPTYGDWSFMKARHRIGEMWEDIPTGIDILVTHGPPKHILDLSYDRDNKLDACGDTSLLRAVKRIRPKYHIFGHIHNCDDIWNQGIRVIDGITFINASVVTDGEFNKGPSSNGVIIEI